MSDILIGSDMNPVLKDGDFKVGDAEGQHVNLILISSKGQWRMSPLIGADLATFSSAPDTQIKDLYKRIRLQLELDGYRNINIGTADGKITINANR